MLLLSLPPEIILVIFKHLETSFRKDPSLLLISKDWYPFARVILFAQLSLTPKSLEVFPPENVLRLMYAHTRSISFELPGYDGAWLPDQYGHSSFTNMGWVETLNSRLLRLASLLPLFAALQKFEFMATFEEEIQQLIEGEYRIHLYRTRRNYLFDTTVSTILNAIPDTITRLVFDTVGSLQLVKEEGGKPVHICPLLKRFKMLEVLRVRMRFICCDIFDFDRASRIEDITVSLTSGISFWDQDFPRLCPSTSCTKTVVITFVPPLATPEYQEKVIRVNTLREHLIKAGKLSLSRMPKLRKAIIVYHQGNMAFSSPTAADYGTKRVRRLFRDPDWGDEALEDGFVRWTKENSPQSMHATGVGWEPM